MSTLEVACGRCDRRFRVRAEFAGRSTRCPGCSAPITVGATARPAPPPRTESADRPWPRPRDEDDNPRRPAGDWGPVDAAFSREQAAVLFLLGSFVSSLVAWLIGVATEGRGVPDPAVIALMLVLLFGPLLGTGVFGVLARLAAMRAPAETRSKGAAVSSLLCALAGLGSLLVLGLAILMAIGGSHGPEPVAIPVSMACALAAGLGALATFLMFVVQVGIARKSADVSQAFGRTAVAVCVCVLGLIGVSFLIALASALSTPGSRGRGSHEAEELYVQVVIVFLVPGAVLALLILYHRLLAAARRALQAEPAGRYDG